MAQARERVRVGIAQAAPAFLDRRGSLEKTIGFLEEAGRRGVDLLAFPEGFIPAHPVWYHFHPATGAKSLELATRLFQNAVEIPGPETEAICAACERAGVNAVVGVCERRPRTTGTLYNTQLFVDRAGRILGKHRKLTPTVGERLVHTGGHGDTLRVFETDVGRVSGLICGENSNPLAVFAMAAEGTQIHVGSWPNHFSRNEHSMVDVITFATRSLSYKCSCFVLNACGTVSAEMLAELPYSEGDREFLEDTRHAGGSSIIGADSMVVAGPMPGDEEGLLVAEIDLEDCVRAKLVHDYSGHYNRADVFSLVVNRSVPELMTSEEREDAEGAPVAPSDAEDGVSPERARPARVSSGRPRSAWPPGPEPGGSGSGPRPPVPPVARSRSARP
jgi:nitrilase